MRNNYRHNRQYRTSTITAKELVTSTAIEPFNNCLDDLNSPTCADTDLSFSDDDSDEAINQKSHSLIRDGCVLVPTSDINFKTKSSVFVNGNESRHKASDSTYRDIDSKGKVASKVSNVSETEILSTTAKIIEIANQSLSSRILPLSKTLIVGNNQKVSNTSDVMNTTVNNPPPLIQTMAIKQQPDNFINMYWIRRSCLPAVFYDEIGLEETDSFWILPICCTTYHYPVCVKKNEVFPLTSSKLQQCTDERTHEFTAALMEFVTWDCERYKTEKERKAFINSLLSSTDDKNIGHVNDEDLKYTKKRKEVSSDSTTDTLLKGGYSSVPVLSPEGYYIWPAFIWALLDKPKKWSLWRMNAERLVGTNGCRRVSDVDDTNADSVSNDNDNEDEDVGEGYVASQISRRSSRSSFQTNVVGGSNKRQRGIGDSSVITCQDHNNNDNSDTNEFNHGERFLSPLFENVTGVKLIRNRTSAYFEVLCRQRLEQLVTDKNLSIYNSTQNNNTDNNIKNSASNDNEYKYGIREVRVDYWEVIPKCQ